MASMARKRSYDESAGTPDEDISSAAANRTEPQQQLDTIQDVGELPTSSQSDAQSPTKAATATTTAADDDDGNNGGDWQLVESRGNKKKKNKKSSRSKGSTIPNRGLPARPSWQAGATATTQSIPPELATAELKSDRKPSVICAAPHMLNSSLKLADLQQLVLYCLADGVGPHWISVCNRAQIRKAVVVMVPGLEKGMFTGDIKLDANGDAAEEEEDDDDEHEDTGVNYASASIDTSYSSSARSPDDYLPFELKSNALPSCLAPFADVFPQLFPMKAPGDDRRVHSPVAAMLNTPLTKSAEEKAMKGAKPARVAKDFVDNPTPITAFLTSTDELIENEFVLHPSSCHSEADRLAYAQQRQVVKATEENGWKDADIPILNEETAPNKPGGPLDAGRTVYAIDCEMCKTEGDEPGSSELALTRISIVDWSGSTVMDELVKPEKPITDYVTAFSGMTAEKLAPVTTTLSDIQQRLLKLLTPDSILIGHSLNSDLNALKMTHPFIVDTSVAYPHPRGPPFKSSLKWLAQKYLNREIQKHDGSMGHDSIEDARAALDLVKTKCRHGPRWGTPEASGEDMFKRLGRTPRPGGGSVQPANARYRDCRTGAVVDHGRPERSIGKNALVSIGCSTDEEIAAGIKRAANGDADGKDVPGGGVDFVFARMRELEALRGWSTDASPHLQQQQPKKTPGIGAEGTEGAKGADEAHTNGEDNESNNNNETKTATTTKQEAKASHRAALTACVLELSRRIASIRASLPKCTLFIVYSGVGDPREMKALSDMQRQFRREYAVKKWDEIEVKWTDEEEQRLKRAVRRARSGIAFVVVT